MRLPRRWSLRRRVRRRRIRRLQPGLRSSIHRTVMRIYNYKLDINDESQFPLILRYGPMSVTCGRLVSLCTLFQQYKLVDLQVSIVPVLINGNSPTPLYMLSGMDREIDPTTNTILESGRRISNTKTTTVRIKSSGRQNDFGYWFDSNNLGVVDKRPTVQFSFSVDPLAGLSGRYIINVYGNYKFRYPQYDVPVVNYNKIMENIVPVNKVIKEEEKEEEEEDIKEDNNNNKENEEDKKKIKEDIKDIINKIENLKIE